MFEIDSIVSATVESVNTTVLLRSGGQEIFVNVPDVFWYPRRQFQKVADIYPIGTQTNVYILGYLYPRRQAHGSLKRANPEDNPYRHLSRQEPGTVFEAKVHGVDSKTGTLSVTLDREHVKGIVEGHRLVHAHLDGKVKSGDVIAAVIEYLDVNGEVLVLEFPPGRRE